MRSRLRDGGTIDRVVVLDLDDTLYLERDYVASGFDAVGRWARGAIGTEDFGTRLRRIFADGVRGRIFDDALEEAGIASSPALVARMVAVYRQHRPAIALAPDAARLLARRDRGTRYALITDGALDSQRRKIRALGLMRHLDVAICTDRWGRGDWKPSPRAFRAIESTFRLPATRFTYVGDNPAKDFDAPAALGWGAVWIRRQGKLERTDPPTSFAAPRAITTLDELDA
ncbi:MAG TPA: HAD family hydrolase [Sphingomonas sp.]|nr:HAD family hydrolase [Sphingomonas sp.]